MTFNWASLCSRPGMDEVRLRIPNPFLASPMGTCRQCSSCLNGIRCSVPIELRTLWQHGLFLDISLRLFHPTYLFPNSDFPQDLSTEYNIQSIIPSACQTHTSTFTQGLVGQFQFGSLLQYSEVGLGERETRTDFARLSSVALNTDDCQQQTSWDS